MSNEQELEQRIAQLEEEVFTNSSSSGSSKKIGHLQNKIREIVEKVRELDSQVENVEGLIERKEEIEDMKQEIEKMQREFQRDVEEGSENIEKMDDRIQEANKVLDKIQKGEDAFEKVLDLWNEEMEKYDDIIMKQAEDVAEWVISTYRLEYAHFRRRFRNYFPEGNLSHQFWQKMALNHKLTKDQFEEIEDHYIGWLDLVEGSRNIEETPTVLSEDYGLFMAWLYRKEMQVRLNEAVNSGKDHEQALHEVFQEDISHMNGADAFPEVCEEFGIAPEDFEEDGAMIGYTSAETMQNCKKILVETYSAKREIPDSKLRKKAQQFLDRFEFNAEGYQQMLQQCGIAEESQEKYAEKLKQEGAF